VHYWLFTNGSQFLITQTGLSKSIPIIGGFHHIHFGIISAIVLLGLSGLIVLDLVSKKLKIFSAIMLIIILVCFHVLSSRTGIVSFYIAALVSFAVYSVRKGRYMLLILGPILMVLMLGITYAASTSFQNKVASTLEDIDSWGKGTEINHKSMAMRIEAYKVAVHLIKNKPFGTGAYGQKQAIMKVYEDNNSVLTIENRKEPHNQFLEFGVKYGWFGIFVMVLLFISLLSLTQNVCYPFIGLVAVLFVSMQFESLLERQVSVYFMSLFIPLYYYLFQRNTINGSALT